MTALGTKKSEWVVDQLVGRKVLLVEDSRTYATALTARLYKEYGIEVVNCGNMDDLRRALETGAGEYSLAVADLNQPGGPRGEALDMLISHNVPPVVFTGSFNESVRTAALAKSVADYVLKDGPSALDNVISSVVRLLSNREVRLLVVDDVTSTRELLAVHLRRQLFDVVKASSGEAAIEELAARPDIDMVIVDYEMPKMNGVQFVRAVRSRREFDRLRIIGVSSAERSDLMTEYLKAGANDYIRRPFDQEEFHWRLAQNVGTLFSMRQLRDMAARDYLTGLHNRRHFIEEGVRTVASAHRTEPKESTSVAVVDIDDFKGFNGGQGGEVGEAVLREISTRLKAACGDRHLLARLGDKKFGILIRGLKPSAAGRFCDALRRAVNGRPVEMTGRSVNVTVSISRANVSEAEAFHDRLNAAGQRIDRARRTAKINETAKRPRAVA